MKFWYCSGVSELCGLKIRYSVHEQPKPFSHVQPSLERERDREGEGKREGEREREGEGEGDACEY